MSDSIMREQLVAQLRKARGQFQFYADNHRAKAQKLAETVGEDHTEVQAALEKAKTNEAMVAEIDGTIGLDDGAGERDMVKAVRSSDVFAPGTLAAIMGDAMDFHRVLGTAWLPYAVPMPLTLGEAQVRQKWMASEGAELVRDTVFAGDVAPGSDAMVDLIAKQADAFIDAIYFAAGGLVRMGIDPSPLWDIAHGQNMAKVQPDGSVLCDADGKIIKPEGWVDPHALQVAEIKRQIEAALA